MMDTRSDKRESTTPEAGEDALDDPLPEGGQKEGHRLLYRLVAIGIVLIALAVVIGTHMFLSERYASKARTEAERRLALHASAIAAQLQRYTTVPLLLARDGALAKALSERDFADTSRRLISYLKEIGPGSLILLDASGKVVAATDRQLLGRDMGRARFFIDALRTSRTVFAITSDEAGRRRFFHARRIEKDGRPLGVIAAEADLSGIEAGWRGTLDGYIVTDSTGEVLLASNPAWRDRPLEEALAALPPEKALEEARNRLGDWRFAPGGFAPGSSTSIIRSEVRIPFRGWRLIHFSTTEPVRERINGIIAIELMAFALLAAFAFYILSRRALTRSFAFERESIALRRLNERLQQEIAEREKAERHLKVAEQSLEQSSKLAALGEMSAAVSHELNQPLAAMKTYLAGARLLLQRGRREEAIASFQRIDDLISRMSTITRQLKSYARKGGDELRPVDMREVVGGALDIMRPQIRDENVRIESMLPDRPVMVMGDQMRLEQVLVNLIRNGIDATCGQAERRIEIMLTGGDNVLLSVRDNGRGIADLDQLFEPFYTTKKPGDGLGLGLAISSSIVADLGGRLSARNGERGGAVFEIHLPGWQEEEPRRAAE